MNVLMTQKWLINKKQGLNRLETNYYNTGIWQKSGRISYMSKTSLHKNGRNKQDRNDMNIKSYDFMIDL